MKANGNERNQQILYRFCIHTFREKIKLKIPIDDDDRTLYVHWDYVYFSSIEITKGIWHAGVRVHLMSAAVRLKQSKNFLRLDTLEREREREPL